ncbi:hypothetical protein PRIC2_013642 [Phytophthora ramorum]
MYIGPWQEYRLAKIQDDAIQRLRQEWEAQLRGQLPPGDDDRIRELMQPLVAKLPAMLLAAKSRTGGLVRNGQSRSGSQSEVGSRCSSRPPSARSTASSASSRTKSSDCGGEKNGGDVQRHVKSCATSNQETHEVSSSRTMLKPPKPKKKGKKAPLTALEQVQKRKKMFATWIKQAGSDNGGTGEQNTSAARPEAAPEAKEATIVTRLPLIQSAAPASAVLLLGEDSKRKVSSPLKLPPLNHSMGASTADSSSQAPVTSPRVSNAADIDLDESVDEEEVNNLLNWTDTLLSPQAMDSFCHFDD